LFRSCIRAVGFSAGGRRVYSFAVSPLVKAVVSFYGTYDLAVSPIAKFRANADGSPVRFVDRMHAAATSRPTARY